jgi:exopolysaccharide biosynthesis predicted pyruvyltransferase EpsI
MLTEPLHRITATLNAYEIVVTNRLHGALISMMMRKKVIFLPVGYHKIESFHDTWLRGKPGTAFINNQQDLMRCVDTLEPFTADLTTLYCERADPALDRHLLGM